MEAGPQVSAQDDYHEYFVGNWILSTAGRDSFVKHVSHDRMAFRRATPCAGPFCAVSQCMFDLEDAHSDDWASMRSTVTDTLAEDAYDILLEAEASTELFDEFFAGFARTSLRGVHF